MNKRKRKKSFHVFSSLEIKKEMELRLPDVIVCNWDYIW